ncbi:IucC family-domain-containing protein [Mycena floridula]|nr:IucC family-domain-containing protein [Mycena floridula]
MSPTLSHTAIERAGFAVSSRLLSCLVTESLLRGYYLPLDYPSATGILVVLSTNVIFEQAITRSLHASDIFAIVPLRHSPIFKSDVSGKHGLQVALVDPFDMLPVIYELAEGDVDQTSENRNLQEAVLSTLLPPPWELGRFKSLAKVQGPERLWNKFVADMLLEDSFQNSIKAELLSSLHWQALSYEKTPECPLLSSPSIEWEQSLVEGHPTHPLHRARMVPVDIPQDYDWYHPIIRFVRVNRARVDVSGSFAPEIELLAQSMANKAGKSLTMDETKITIPVHELQLPTILSKFDGVEVLDEAISVRALAQSSIRTVLIPELPGKALKLAVNVKISSSLRTISHFTANFGPRFTQDIVPKLFYDRDLLAIEGEPASAVYSGVDPETAKHLTAVLRDQYIPKEGENVIVCAALLESGHAGASPGVSAVEHIFKLDTPVKRAEFLDRYIQIACEALVPPLLHNGVAFEAHAQNILARFDVRTGDLLGFIVRDLGGLRVHPETLIKSTGVDFEFLPGHCVATKTVDEIYPKFYHTLVHNHLQRLIRLLGMHYDGSGYVLLRKHLAAIIPVEHRVHREWMTSESTTVSGKCLMRMRLQGVYRDMVYSPFPNLIQYHGVNIGKDTM